MKKAILHAWSIALAALFAACTTLNTPTRPENTYFGEAADGEVALEESLGDSGLARDLVMENILTRRQSDRLQVQFNLRNTRRTSIDIEWAITWVDQDGFELETSKSWTPATIGAEGYQAIQQTAPTPNTSGFRLRFRRTSPIY